MNKLSRLRSKLINELILPKKFHVLISFLLKKLGDDLDVYDFLDLSEYCLRRIDYMGDKKVVMALELQSYLKEGNAQINNPKPSFVMPDNDTLSNLGLSYLLLTTDEQLVIKKISKRINIPLGDLSLLEIISFDSKNRLRGFGGSFLENHNGLIKKIKRELVYYFDEKSKLILTKFSPGDFIRYIGLIDIASERVDLILSSEISLFMSFLDDRDLYIFTCYFGINCERSSLLEISQNFSMNITKQRVSQLLDEVILNFSNSMLLSKKTLIKTIKSDIHIPISERFKLLSNMFNNTDCCAIFLEKISGLPRLSIRKSYEIEFSNFTLNNLYLNNKAPLSLDLCINEIQKIYGYDLVKTNIVLERLESSNQIKITSDGIYSLNLKKYEVVAQAALFYPNGAHYTKLHLPDSDNESLLSESKSDKLSSALCSLCNENIIILCGVGEYKHTMFIDIGDNVIEKTLNILKSFMKNKNKAYNLKIDIHEKIFEDLDYYTLRHIVRNFGHEKGIYFKGKSGGDTISLKREFSSKCQKSSVLEYIKKNGPFTTKDIVNFLPSNSISLAGGYINQLLQEKKLARSEPTIFDIPDRVFLNIPISGILDLIKSTLCEFNSPVEIVLISKLVNDKFNINKSNAFYISLIKHHYSAVYGNMHISRRFVSLSKIPIDVN